MNPIIQCVLLLTGVGICTSAVAIRKCQCLSQKTLPWVNYKNIAAVENISPTPFCSKQEIIVTLKSGGRKCLNPGRKFANQLLKAVQILSHRHAQKPFLGFSTTTTASTTSVLPTQS